MTTQICIFLIVLVAAITIIITQILELKTESKIKNTIDISNIKEIREKTSYDNVILHVRENGKINIEYYNNENFDTLE
jgi:phage pi2 protein 07